MKFRVRCDLAFDNEAYAKKISSKAISINEGEANEEIGFVDYELCGHDEFNIHGYREGKPCQKIERVEIRKLER